MVAQLQVFILAWNLLGILAAQNTSSRGCLPHFRSDPAHFEPCKTKVCFLFISEAPFVNLDPTMVQENNQTVFLCKDRRLHFPDLSGIIFNVKDVFFPVLDALCVYGGNQCTFDGMIDFISEHSTPEIKYRFGVTGIVKVLPYRIIATSKPTVPIMEGKIVIVGPRSAPTKNDDLTRMILPFELGAWLSIFIVVICFWILWVLVACVFTRQLSLRIFLQLVVGEYEPEMMPTPEQPGRPPLLSNSQKNLRLSKNMAITVLRSSFKVFLATTIIFYEVLIAYHIFEQRAQPVTIDVQGLTKADLSKYVVIEKAAQEFVFRKTVDPERKYDIGTVPWNRCRNLEDCVEKLLDKTHPAEFMVSYDFAVRYHLHKLKACGRLAVYNTKHPLFAVNAGWYLNSNVPGPVRDDIDRSIISLRLEDKIRRILSRAVEEKTPLHYGKQSPRMPGRFLVPLLAVVLGPFVIIVILMLVWGCAIQIAASRLRGD